ncbi:unnamed protein product [Victoria cruziana]
MSSFPSSSRWSDSTRSPGAASRSCLCSPTSHPGSFRCSFHRDTKGSSARPPLAPAPPSPTPRLGPVSGSSCLVRRALLARSTRSTGHDLRKHRSFEAKPTR